MKYNRDDFTENSFLFIGGGMTGKSIIEFNENKFLYSERDSLFYGSGFWDMTDDKKYLVLNGIVQTNTGNSELSIKKSINMKLRIKSKNQLIGENGEMYRRVNKL